MNKYILMVPNMGMIIRNGMVPNKDRFRNIFLGVEIYFENMFWIVVKTKFIVLPPKVKNLSFIKRFIFIKIINSLEWNKNKQT